MAYSSVHDVRLALAPEGEAEGQSTAATLGDEQIQNQIDEADSTIYQHLYERYVIAEDPENAGVAVAPIRWWSRNIAAYLATLVFKRHKDLDERDPIQLRYNATLALLEKAASGELTLNLPGVEDFGGGVVVENQYEGRLFGPEDFGLVQVPGDMWDYYHPYYWWHH